MSSDSGGESLAALLEAVHEIEPVIRAHAADAEASRRLPDGKDVGELRQSNLSEPVAQRVRHR